MHLPPMLTFTGGTIGSDNHSHIRLLHGHCPNKTIRCPHQESESIADTSIASLLADSFGG